ncbi:dihydrofolate reductase family protein [Pseudomonas qingdaonensis]|nr:dihydrofolate reductase family protein [Pseudomonas qingdaonensis]
MTIKCSVFIAASIDGFIARPDGDIEWLHRPDYETAELNGVTYEQFIAGVDALVMGRKTLDKVLSFPNGRMQASRSSCCPTGPWTCLRTRRPTSRCWQAT